MRCPHCRTDKAKPQVVKNYHYLESGLPNVYLAEIPVRTCGDCGGRFVSIPNLEGLHRAIALVLVGKKGRLAPAEVKFLRKSLGWSGSDFARKFHTTPQQVSRWESAASPVVMNKSSELLLRALVMEGEKIGEYRDSLEKVALEKAGTPRRIKLLNREGAWLAAA